jgi:hypothetical protein
MTILKRHVEGLVSANPVTIGTVGLGSNQIGAFSGARYGKLLGIVARNYASSAKAGAGTDTACKLKITDGNSNVVYLDASDRDYATAEVVLNITQDDTATGLGVTPVDATGAAATAGAGAPVLMKSPVQVAVVNGATATDYISVDLIVEV